MADAADTDLSTQIGLVLSIGSYEKILHVYKFLPLSEEALDFCFSQKAHEGMIRATAVSGPFIATASSDETVRIVNTRKKLEEVLLTDHEGKNSNRLKRKFLIFTQKSFHLWVFRIYFQLRVLFGVLLFYSWR